MIGILLITHGTLGESLVQNACHILKKRPPLLAQLGVAAEDDPLAMLPFARGILAQVDGGEGVLVMTDIYGATPANIAGELLKAGRVEGVAGVSLPMLLRALNYREAGMNTLVARALSGARDGALDMLKDV
ncbi:MAG: PTS fructose transporter subunit IIA [Betaproteobacteria bacterium]|nr:PTS fructose transporter subunit IIA [Betaproteobacteria bacterium]